MTRIILVTGGSGFVGRQILKTLAGEPVRLRLVARTPSRLAFTAAWKNVERIIPTPDMFAESADWWQEACAGVDTLIHAAWYAEPGHYLHSPLNLDCLIGTLEMAKGVVAAHLRRFVGLGTCLEYAASNHPHPSDAPLLPQTPYAGAKAATYSALAQWLPSLGVEFCWCRLFHLHGEGEDPRRLMPYLRAQMAAGKIAALSPGTQTLDFLDVAQAGRMIVEAALGDAQGATNVCSGSPITVKQVAERIADEYGRRDLLDFGTQSANSAASHLVGIPGQAHPTYASGNGKGKP
ncbi:MAG: NAD(P)-dependent oxidoreductase [Dechloromonas sp.]|uniref:NAD-dependent epimerase/dehydratase family protein n=1 Tax=Dechloromonas sp. TaxID=1917218 RepID=UPI0027F51E70|nr:NAD(P)-dependent oxidoreductase [Dechloromonas sp.]MBT9520021.1 NAD(P)-dependent oxidoreductase [Dechloromonas sp.]